MPDFVPSTPTQVPSGLVITVASHIGVESGDRFRIAALEYDVDYFSPAYKFTADGHTTHQRKNNLMLDGGLLIRGWVIEGFTIGVANMVHAANRYVDLTLQASASRVFVGTWIVERMKIRYHREAALLPIAMILSMHNTAASAIEGS